MEQEIKYKTVKEIVEETIEYYSTNPRSQRSDMCLYKGPNGAQCAFKRVTKPEVELIEGLSASDLLSLKGHEILLPEYSLPNMQEVDVKKFYNALQSFHDTSENWIPNEKGNDLTQKGKSEALKIIELFSQH